MPVHARRKRAGSLALGDPDQPVAGDDGALVGFRDITEADELGEMSRGNVGVGSMHRDLDQGGELLRCQKVWRMDRHGARPPAG